LTGEYGQNGVYAGILARIGNNGVISTKEFPLSDSEKEGFAKSVEIIKEATDAAMSVIK
jgi:malate/lactate dehydrogenase